MSFKRQKVFLKADPSKKSHLKNNEIVATTLWALAKNLRCVVSRCQKIVRTREQTNTSIVQVTYSTCRSTTI